MDRPVGRVERGVGEGLAEEQHGRIAGRMAAAEPRSEAVAGLADLVRSTGKGRAERAI
ncbi:hypothetical protein GCM10010468_80160 [Actinocorallia longicatena]|uniref:Uncharacterized protein n=1 Tax=Actinocorallia longicatena TaxID=111803 RepID=A0ABP6QRI3_9ACTN